MRLPDFHSDPVLNSLREMMGADQVVALPIESDWEDWAGFGIDIGDIGEVAVNPDSTLSYRGRRVLVYIRDQYATSATGDTGYRYHLAECKTLSEMRRKNRFGRYVVTTRTDGSFIVNLIHRWEPEPIGLNLERRLGVCYNCLEALNWKGFRDQARSERARCRENFDPREFLDAYGSRIKGLPIQTDGTQDINQYPPDWEEISRKVRASAGWQCSRCSLALNEGEMRRWLHVHHRDGNRANCAAYNLEVLCLVCHSEEPRHHDLKRTPGYSVFATWRKSRLRGL